MHDSSTQPANENTHELPTSLPQPVSAVLAHLEITLWRNVGLRNCAANILKQTEERFGGSLTVQNAEAIGAAVGAFVAAEASSSSRGSACQLVDGVMTCSDIIADMTKGLQAPTAMHEAFEWEADWDTVIRELLDCGFEVPVPELVQIVRRAKGSFKCAVKEMVRQQREQHEHK